MNTINNMDFAAINLSRSPLEGDLKLNSTKNAPSKEDLKEACQQFEAILLNYLMQKMRDTIPKNDFLGGGLPLDIVQSMHDEALTKEMVKGGGIGLAEQLYDDLSKYI